MNFLSNNNTHFCFNNELNMHKWSYMKASGLLKDLYSLAISPLEHAKTLGPSLGVKNPSILQLIDQLNFNEGEKFAI